MKKLLLCVLCMLMLFSQMASAAMLDFSNASASASFANSTIKNLEKYTNGKILTPARTKATALTNAMLASLTPGEIAALENSIFAQQEGIEYWTYVDGLENGKYKKNISKLTASRKKAVESLRAEQKKIDSALKPLKSGDKIDLDGDGKAETIRYALDPEDGMWSDGSLTINNQTIRVDLNGGYKKPQVLTLNAKTGEKALLLYAEEDNLYIGCTVVTYKNGTIRRKSLGTDGDVRYDGVNTFYTRVRNVPFDMITCYTLNKNGALNYKGIRPTPYQSPLGFDVYDKYSDIDKNDILRLKLLNGEYKDYKTGAGFCVLTLGYTTSYSHWCTQEGIEYLALLDDDGEVVLLNAEESGYYVGGGDSGMLFIDLFRGASYIS